MLDAPLALSGLPLEHAEPLELTCILDHSLDPSGTEGANELALQIFVADEEPEGLHVRSRQIGAEAHAFEGLAEITLLAEIAEPGQSHSASHILPEMGDDVGRSTHRHDGDVLGLEASPPPSRQGQERVAIAFPFDEDDTGLRPIRLARAHLPSPFRLKFTDTKALILVSCLTTPRPPQEETFMSRTRWTRISAMILVAGGLAFFLKLIAIPTTGGDDFESGVVALFFFAGMFGMLVGSTALGSKLAQRAPLAVYGLALLLSPIVIWFVFMLLDEGLKPIGEAGPDWYAAEAGITAIAILMIAAGLWLLRKGRTASPAVPPGGDSNAEA